MDLCCLLWETVLISCSLLKVVMYFCDKLVCFWKHKNTQAWLMTRVKAWEGQNTGRKSVICLTLALTQKVIRLQEVLQGMTGQSICNNNNNGDDNVATEKNRMKPYFLFIWCPSRRWSHFNSSTTKVLQLFHFLRQTPLVHHDEFYLKAKGYPITIVIKFQSIPSFILINTNFLTVFVLGKYCNIKLVCVWSLTKCTEDSCCPQYSLLSSYSQDCLDQLQGHCWNMLMKRYNQTNKDW